MDPQRRNTSLCSGRLPRASGDGPVPSILWRTRLMVAPRERGWTPVGAGQKIEAMGCPARAGMDPSAALMLVTRARLPRASGDGPVQNLPHGYYAKVAPRERGWTLRAASSKLISTGCPARAGMDPTSPSSRARTWGLPRASGDGPKLSQRTRVAAEVAPRERGWTLHWPHGRWSQWGCPARAGMDLCNSR